MVALTKQRAAEGIPTEEEAFNFFVGKETNVEERREAEGTEQEPEEQLLQESELLTFWGKPPYQPFAKQREEESRLYKIPSLKTVPVDDKVPEGAEPRFWEEEGFYVGKPPQVSNANLNIMENRIMDANQGTRWFGEDGQLKRLSSPLKEKPTRPPIISLEDVDPLLQTEWVKAHMEPFDGRFIDTTDEEAAHYQLDVDLSTLTFTHHPLFSKEHVLASRLQLSYRQYMERRKKALSAHYSDKLSALKIALQQLQGNIEKAVREHVFGNFLGQVGKKEFGPQKDTNVDRERAIWADRLYEADAALKIDFLREEFEAEYQNKLAEYEEELRGWKKEAKRRKRARQEGQDSSLTSERDGSDEGLPPRPTRPPKFDEIEEYENLKENARQNKRAPGEPILIPELTMTTSVSPIDQVTRSEKLRRSEMQNWSAFIKVLFNGKEVSRTVVKPCNLFCKLLLGQPLDFGTNNEVDSQPPIYLLTSGTILANVSWAVGNDGMAMAPPLLTGNSATNMSAVKRYDALAALGAAGMVDIQNLIKWIEQSHLDPNDPANADIMNIVKLTNSLKDGPSAPQYFRLNQLEEECEFVSQKEFAKSKRFKLIQLRDKGVPEFKNFKMIPTRDREIPDNIFEAYEKRQRGEEEEEAEDEISSHKTIVTKFLNRIRDDVTQRALVAKRQVELKDMVIEDEVPNIGDIGVKLGQLLAPRRPLRPKRRERKVVGAQNLTVSDVKIFINVVRALDIPVRDDTQTVGGSQGAGARFGAGASLRQGATINQFTGGAPGYGGASSAPQDVSQPSNDPWGQSQVRPFVEAVFQGNFARTSVANGPNPSWNEQLILPFRAPNNDYSPETLQTVNDVVYLNLFDEVVFNILQDDRQLSTNIHQRLERHWLGSIEIPFSTIYFNNKVEGTFRVNTPPVLLGYHKRGRHSGAPGGLGIISRDDTLLTLFLTIEPPLQPSQPLAERFESNEDDKLLHNAQLWLQGPRKRFPKREYKALATDLTGKKVFLTRFIRSQNPPDELVEESQYKMERIARYVSMIPFISDSAAFPDICDIWATSEEFLRMLAGDEEEHAVLLCNYFLHIGKKAYVVLGRGIPEGSTAYVLTMDGPKLLWNAHTGHKYDVQDANCPLKSVGCIVNHENIWGNVQVSDEPYRLLFELTKTSCWQPFFTRSYPRPPLLSVQKEVLEYKRVDREYVTGLQEKIEKILRDKIMSWRPRFVTRWNRYCTQAFRSLLAKDIGVKVGQLLAPRRPLRPKRRERKVVGAQNLTVSDVKIFINVVRALDIPVRDDTQTVGGSQGAGARFGAGASLRQGATINQFTGGAPGYGGASSAPQDVSQPSNDPWGQSQVRPFVEAVFQGNFARTSVANGPNPSWNEQLILPFRAPNNDYSPETLQTVNDVVYLNLFDEVVFNILQDDRQLSTNIHQRLERHWLGSIEIPFSTIYFNNKERIARYVSMIPFISDSAAFPDICDIWATSEEFLRMLAGDEEEHAVLLCNYFLHIGKKAYVVLGRGIPEGSTAYVLTMDGPKLLWNAHTGHKYDVQDANCPLKSVGCIVNHENIWGNVQVSDEPYRLLFELTKTSCWQPFFTRSYPRPPLLSVQKEVLEYKRVDREYVTGLQEKIEKILRDKIMSWRPRFVTRWNRYCTQAFRSLLANMEQSVSQATAVNHAAELDQILTSYKLSGFPINMCFTEVPPVSESVFSTGVHTIEDPDVEFALAVHIHPYPQGVFSLWIYVGTLRRKAGY
ncbi:PREDICTED: coiled-coil and C2 domain-containing protein 2A-like [Acropora digitifera]|uniref:coiled-coil and C2 domain-containing protein 2A-like n=1 Tax=Acropora digitifera TaxID=70779 RepID=UPI00077AEED0|nr:PREDICTED: coiled-coil and C2 domain-containing protein 2A-like [Acropora digitifera]